MAITNAEIDKLSIPDSVKAELKKMKQSPTAFTNISLIPSEVSWIVTVDMLERQSRKLFETYLGPHEIQDVTVHAEHSNERPKILMWLNPQSKHLVDKSVKTDEMPVKFTVRKFSDALKQLCDQFAPTVDEHGNEIPRKKRIRILQSKYGQPMSGIEMDLLLVVNRLFDLKSVGFKEVYGDDNVRACSIYMKPIFEGRNEETKRLTSWKITKCYADSGHNKRPIPVYRDRRRDN